jgi:hypothetical protein
MPDLEYNYASQGGGSNPPFLRRVDDCDDDDDDYDSDDDLTKQQKSRHMTRPCSHEQGRRLKQKKTYYPNEIMDGARAWPGM